MSTASTPLTDLPASHVQNQFLKDVPEPLRLDKVRIVGDMDLRFCTVKRPIQITGATFAGTVDFRNATFSSTLLLEGCTFEQPVNAGNRDLSHCVCESDLSFKGSTFNNTAWFFGLECKGSGNFRNCIFLRTEPGNPLRDELQPVDFTEADFAKELNLVGAQLHGSSSFNSMKCGIGGFFREACFGKDNPNSSVDFVGSSFGLVCDLSRAVFNAPAMFEGLTTGLVLDLRHSRFLKPYEGTWVSFDYVSTTHLTMYGAVFDCDVSFSGISCKGDARVDFALVLDDMKDELVPGTVSNDLRRALAGAYVPLDESATLVKKGAVWLVRASEKGPDYELRNLPDPYGSTKRQLVIPTIFRGSVSFARSSCSNFQAAGALFDGIATFKGLSCVGSASFENAVFEASKAPALKNEDCIDFSFSSCGLNFEFARVDCRRRVSFESATIKGGLLLTGGTFAEGLNLTNASMHTLSVGNGDALVLGKSRLDNCRFDIFDASDDVEQIWKKLVAAQDPRHFTRDPYQMIETYYRGKGMRHLADRVYFDGRDADRTFVGTGANKRILDTLAWFLTGYGVELRRLGYGIALFLIVGTFIFSCDGALAPAKPVTPAQQTPASRTVSTPCYLKVAHGFGYSLGSLLPLVDLHLSKDWEPVGDWRRAYLALHIGAGWIFFPLLLAGITAQLNKN
jgi:Pentapeptide repeats (9 copies)